MKTRLECVIPILCVKEIPASIEYYENVLGFEKEWGDDAFAAVARDGFSIYLCQGDQGCSGTWVWVGVENVDILFEEYKEKGAKIQLEPTNYSWALEMRVEDPDGHVLRIGSGPREDEPYQD